MAATQLKVTLPEDIADRLRARVAAGQYASESELVLEALEDFEDRDRSHNERLERWLQVEGRDAHGAWKADPGAVSTIAEVRARLDARRRAEDRG